jgi:hypothetical protein
MPCDKASQPHWRSRGSARSKLHASEACLLRDRALWSEGCTHPGAAGWSRSTEPWKVSWVGCPTTISYRSHIWLSVSVSLKNLWGSGVGWDSWVSPLSDPWCNRLKKRSSSDFWGRGRLLSKEAKNWAYLWRQLLATRPSLWGTGHQCLPCRQFSF